MRTNLIRYVAAAALPAALLLVRPAVAASPVVPGRGAQIVQVGDDFEAENWTYIFRNPKSSRNINKDDGGAGGESKNDRWYEGIKRGHPDIVKTVPTPKGGLPGSKRSLLLRSLHTGVPGRPTFRLQQDDFIANLHYRLDGSIPVRQSPSVVVRVFLPKVAEWEKRTGPHFAFRLATDTTIWKRGKGLFSPSGYKKDTYWPGMFIEFESKADSGRDYDAAYIRIRANEYGGDFKGPQIKTTGWWTLGMSCTPDGMVHYYAKPGVKDLTSEDYLTSQYPYGYRCEALKTFFFNVCNGDDGRTWSTAWVIDDPKVFVLRR